MALSSRSWRVYVVKEGSTRSKKNQERTWCHILTGRSGGGLLEQLTFEERPEGAWSRAVWRLQGEQQVQRP